MGNSGTRALFRNNRAQKANAFELLEGYLSKALTQAGRVVLSINPGQIRQFAEGDLQVRVLPLVQRLLEFTRDSSSWLRAVA